MKVATNGSIIDQRSIKEPYALVNDAYIGAYLMLIDKYGLFFKATPDNNDDEGLIKHFFRLKKENFPKEKVYKKVKSINEYMVTFASHIYEIDNPYFKIYPGNVDKVWVSKENGQYVYHEEPMQYSYTEQIVTREEIEDLLSKVNVGKYTFDCRDASKEPFPSEKEILDMSVEHILALDASDMIALDPKLVKKCKAYADHKMTTLSLEDFIGDITFFDRYLVFKKDDELREVANTAFKYAGKGKYLMKVHLYRELKREKSKEDSRTR